MPSTPRSKFSAWIVPGTTAGVPAYGLEPDAAGDDAALKRSQLMLPTLPLAPFASMTILITCVPAESDTKVLSVAHACQPPVFGMASGPVLLIPATSIWKEPPLPLEAT